MNRADGKLASREENYPDLQQHLRVLFDDFARRETIWRAELEELGNTEKRLRQRIERDQIQADRLRKVGNSLELMLRADTEEEILEVVFRTLSNLFPEGRCRCLMVSSSRMWLEERMGEAKGAGEKGSCHGARSNECWAVRLGKVFVSEPAKRPHCRMIEQVPEIGAAVCLPLLANGSVMGILSLLIPLHHELVEDDVEFLELYSNSIAIILFNLRKRNALEALALVDQLTELPNRRLILAAAEQEITRSVRFGKQFALAIIDLDNFKEVNDRYGHEEGDRALRLLAVTARETLRGSDVLARWGGEEFLLLLPEIGEEEARAAVERFRRNYTKATQAPETGLAANGLTFSAGLVIYPADGQTMSGLLEKADQRLYLAKKTGRNRIVASDEKTPA